ncbi:MAG TPA: YciC family protein [Planctomycetota bacterium]|nr:YciC family protein [Planctomycetota bacterium]
MQSFDTGTILGVSFRLWIRHLPGLVALSAVAFLPTILVELFATRTDRFGTGTPMLGFGAQFLVCVFTMVAYAFLAGAATRLVLADLQGERVTASDAVTTALRRLPALLGVSFIVGLLVAGGLILLIVPGIMIAVAHNVAPCVAIAEGADVSTAMRRGRDLTRGRRWGVFAVVVVLGIVVGILAVATTMLLQLAGPEGVSKTTLVLQQIPTLIFAPLGAVASAAMYFALRKEKEGVDVASMARAFA